MLFGLTWVFSDPTRAHNKRVKAAKRAQKHATKAKKPSFASRMDAKTSKYQQQAEYYRSKRENL